MSIHKALEKFALNQSAIEDIVNRYERLSYFEREEIPRWLKANFSKIPIPFKTKKVGLENLIAGEYQSLATLMLINHALQTLRL